MNGARSIALAGAAMVAAAVGTGMLGGCGSSPTNGLTPSQIDAIQTREVRAPRDSVLRAAATVMLDEGYIISMSDHAAGLIGGFRLSAGDISERYQRTGGMEGRAGALDGATLWVRAVDPGACTVRAQLISGGGIAYSESMVTEVVRLIERRVMADAGTVGAAGAPGVRP